MDNKIIVGIIAVVVVIGAAVLLLDSGENDIVTEPADTTQPVPTDQTTTPEPAPNDTATPPDTTQPTTDGESIVDLTMANDDLSTLVAAITAAGISDVLATDGPFTVFAPTDSAFADLPAGTVDELLEPENSEQLQNVLASHVVLGINSAADLEDGMIVTTLNEQELEVSISDDGTVMIGNSTVIEADIEASNGVIHVVDTVIQS